MIKKIIIIATVLVLVLCIIFYINRVKIREAFLDVQKDNLPEPVSYNQVKRLAVVDGKVEVIDVINLEADLQLPSDSKIGKDNSSEKLIESQDLPAEINLDIPFTSQAPFAVWDEIHKDACEETSVIMAIRFLNEKDIISPSDADDEIAKIVKWEQNFFGYWQDTDVEKTADILREYYKLKNIEVKFDITLDDIRREIAQGNPVIIPAAGRLLGNPYYTPPGPYYHMLVVKGYTKDKIITNDPGTRHGADFAYKNQVFYNAIHDWNGGDVANGKKAMIVVKK